MIVDPNGAKLKLGRKTHGAPNIFSKNRGSQSIEHIIPFGQRVRLIVKFLDCDDRAENFILNDLPVLLNTRYYSRLIVIALIKSAGDAATSEDPRSLRFGTIYKTRDALTLDPGDQWPHLDTVVKGQTNPYVLHGFNNSLLHDLHF